MLDPETLPLDGEVVGGELHAILKEEAGNHRLWLRAGVGPFRAAIIIPLDEYVLLRVHSLLRLHRRLTGRAAGPLPRWQRVSAYELYRMALMLRAWDGVAAGASRREIASVLFDRNLTTLRAIDWQNAPERRRLARILKAARQRIDGGYLRLLRGEPLAIHLFRLR